MSELKPCPFCGGEAELSTRKGRNGMTQYKYRCSKCHASIGRWHGGISGHPWTALEAWNSRAERTCKVIEEQHNYYGYQTQVDDYTFSLSCGHVVTWDDLPDYCPCCGAKVVS